MDEVSATEMADLAARCDQSDHALVKTPASVLERTFRPSGEGHYSLAGRSLDGTLRAIATVRKGQTPVSRDAAIRAMIDPAWRGRGIGRSLLRWQDGLALDRLAGSNTQSMIAVPIAAHLIDRRRLYTAGGLSFAARLEYRSRILGDSPAPSSDHLEPPPPAPGWKTRKMSEDDRVALEELYRIECRDRYSFVAKALSVADLVALSDPGISRVAEREGTLSGAVMAMRAESHDGRPLAVIVGLMLSSKDQAVALGLLGATFQAMWAEGLHEVVVSLTPACRERWGEPLEKMACVERGADLIYGIELT